jgi:hypothetical protein
MGLGIILRELWRLRAGVAASVVLAAVVAVWSVERVSLVPPGLHPRALRLASASTRVLVDTPRSAAVDLRQSSSELQKLTDRAVLLSNIVANGPARDAIARRARIDPARLQIAGPLTPSQPRARVGPRGAGSPRDILQSGEQYRLSIQANPVVPVLDIYAQAPTTAAAVTLADAAVEGLGVYLARVAQEQRTPISAQVRLVQVGRAEGGVINGGVRAQAVALAFLLTFVLACASVVFVSRVRRGWRLAAGLEQASAG